MVTETLGNQETAIANYQWQKEDAAKAGRWEEHWRFDQPVHAYTYAQHDWKPIKRGSETPYSRHKVKTIGSASQLSDC